jgi:hypothetical protein
MADLSELAKKLQEQVDIITTYLEKEKLPFPSFIPDHKQPLKSALGTLPPEIEKARAKAGGLSLTISQLLTHPLSHLTWTAFSVISFYSELI